MINLLMVMDQDAYKLARETIMAMCACIRDGVDPAEAFGRENTISHHQFMLWCKHIPAFKLTIDRVSELSGIKIDTVNAREREMIMRVVRDQTVKALQTMSVSPNDADTILKLTKFIMEGKHDKQQ